MCRSRPSHNEPSVFDSISRLVDILYILFSYASLSSNDFFPSKMAPSGPLKRKQLSQSSNPPPSDKREAKRIKIAEARTIHTQPSDKALSSNGDLDVSAFVKAREFEIKAMCATMGASKIVLSTRAFQQVPRDLRRRTASHNVKKVPKRLRVRLAKEVRRADKQYLQPT